MRRLTRTLATPLALGGLLVLGACSADETPADDPTESQAPTAEETETAAPEDEDEGDDVATGGDDCLEGDWTAESTGIQETLLANPAFAELEPEVEITGEAVLSFEGGVMTSTYTDNRVKLSMSLEGQEFVTETVMDGTTTGTYTVSGDTLTVSDVDMSGAEIDSTTTINGEEMEVPDLGDVESYGVDLGGDSTIECTADELRLTPQVEGGEEFVQVLTRK